MPDEPAEKQSEASLDGKRLRLHELNPGPSVDDSNPGRIQRLLRNLSQFLAGMYTGESCAGTPHSERSKSSISERQEGD